MLETSPKADESYYINFYRLWSVDGKYWTVTSVGYGRSTKITDFDFLYNRNEYRLRCKFTESYYNKQ
jgi:hypothetical protein